MTRTVCRRRIVRRKPGGFDSLAGAALCCLSVVFALNCDGAPQAAKESTAGGETSVTAAELDRRITDVLGRPEFSWRLPRQKSPNQEVKLPGFLEDFSRWLERVGARIGTWFEKLGNWFDKLLKRDQSERTRNRDDRNWQDPVRVLLFSLVALTASILGILAYRILRRKRGAVVAGAKAVATASALLESGIQPDRLPADEWSRMALEFLAKGELRFAVRAWFLACLSHLAKRGRLTLARHKSNRDYARELNRRAHDAPAVIGAFAENVAIHEKAWYGFHAVTEQMLASYRSNHETICRETERV